MIEEEITEKSVKKRGEVLCGEEILESSISEGPSVLTMHQQLRAYREKQQQKFRVKSQNGTTTPINKDNNGNSESRDDRPTAKMRRRTTKSFFGVSLPDLKRPTNNSQEF